MIVDAIWEAAIRKSVREQKILRNSFDSVTKFNPNHDELGRFTTGGVSSAVADSIIARVKANGGLSVKILTGEEPTDGFMVAQQGHNLEVKEEDFFDAKKGKAALSAYLKAKKLVFGKDQYLGLWWNKDEKEISLDVVDKIKTRSQATKAGRERNQQAIWDVKNQEEINTGGTGDRTTEPTLASSETSKAFGGDDGSGDRGFRVPSLGKFRSGKQRVVQQTIRAKVFKVSFGGDRSEAGRFAANQRWKDHVKGEVKTPVSAKAKDITKDLAVYFGFGDDHSFYRQILKGSEGDKEIKKRTNQLLLDGKEIGDIQLQIIAEKQGFAGKPTVVSSEKMKQLEEEGWKIVYRGIKDVFKPEATGVVLHTSEKLAKEFVSGDYWAGRGYMGNGIYFSDDLQIAREYSYITDAYRGTVLKVAIPPNTFMKKEQFVQTVIDKQSSLEHAFGGDQDMGRYLAAMGHRAVEAKENYFIVWDRSMLAVEELSVV